jgi:amino acid permease
MKILSLFWVVASTATASKGVHSSSSPPSLVIDLRGGASRRPAVVPNLQKGPLAGLRKKIPNPSAPAKKESQVSGGKATIPNEIFNLVKAIVGVGVLSLPAGIAAFGNGKSAVIPAVALIVIMGCLSGYGFAIIGKVCAYTGATSYREAWNRSVSPKAGWLPAWSATLKTSLACLAFSMVLADTFSSLLGSTERTKVLLVLTTFILLPLCWMKSLASLAPFSLLGVLGMLFTGFAMLVKYLDGSYAGPVEGTLLETVAENLRPSFGSDGWESVLNPKSLILVCMLSTAFMAHFNAPKFYLELENNTLKRYNTVVATSFGISILLMGSITAIGFLTFGGSCSGLVLNNYSSQDMWMATSRIAVAIALVFSYPLAFQGCRDGILDLLKVSEDNKSKASFLNLTTICLLSTITFFAAILTDVSFVLAFGGGT